MPFSSRPSSLRRVSTLILLLLLAGPVLQAGPPGVVGAPPAAAAAVVPSCSAFATNVLERVKPTTGVSSLTLDPAVATAHGAAGFTSVRDVSMRASRFGGPGLASVHRLHTPRYGGDYFYATSKIDIERAIRIGGYTDLGVVFYASEQPLDCMVGLTSYYKEGRHRLVTSPADTAALAAAGWKRERVRFYLGRAPVDPTFTVAVYPDTQQEVSSDLRFRNRADYLVANRRSLDLRYVTHVGDVVNWDTPDHAQYEVARRALVPLEQAGIPYSLTIGNHDTQATGPGGSARDPQRTRELQRDSTTFNAYLNRQTLNLEGAYEPGKVDNTVHAFTAGGVAWMVLNLELWPRPGAVQWAQRVVEAHPKHNVIIVTHSYLTSGGAIYTGADYGDTPPSQLATQLVKRYANVRLVLSGHVGTYAHRVDTGVHGNRIDSFGTNWTSNTTNRMRLITVDTKARTLKTWVYAPYTDESFPEATVDLRGLTWVG